MIKKKRSIFKPGEAGLGSGLTREAPVWTIRSLPLSVRFILAAATTAAGVSVLTVASGCGGGGSSGAGAGGATTTTSGTTSSTTSSTSSTTSSTSSTTSSTSSTTTTSTTTTSSGPVGVEKLDHIVVIYLENHSFDNLYGEFPGAEGITQAMAFAAAHPQVDADGKAYATLPPDPEKAPMAPILPNNLPNGPFLLDPYVGLSWTDAGTDGGPSPASTPDVTHRYYHEIAQINGGKMNQFVWVNQSLGMAMGYYHTSKLPLAAEAAKYTLCDHFFHGAFGGSFLNHQWLVAAATPRWESTTAPPASLVTVLDPKLKAGSADAVLTPAPDYDVINTSYSVNKPVPPFVTDPTTLIPSFTNKTIGDLLIAAGVSWAWYSGGWDAALAGNPDPLFQFHHQPFQFYQSFADGTANKAKYLLDESKFIAAAAAGTLPAVSFVKPIGEDNEHPSYADIATGEKHTLDLINAVRSGPNWKSTAIIITYDEHGGYWDHVPPPTRDKWGPGARVPTIVISPYAKMGKIDSTSYDTTAILKLIEKRFNLPSLSDADKNAADLAAGAFDFTQTP